MLGGTLPHVNALSFFYWKSCWFSLSHFSHPPGCLPVWFADDSGAYQPLLLAAAFSGNSHSFLPVLLQEYSNFSSCSIFPSPCHSPCQGDHSMERSHCIKFKHCQYWTSLDLKNGPFDIVQLDVTTLLASLWWHLMTAVFWRDITVLHFLMTYSEFSMPVWFSRTLFPIDAICLITESKEQIYTITLRCSNQIICQCLHLMAPCIMTWTVSFLKSVHDFSQYGTVTTSVPLLMLLIISWMTLDKSPNLFELYFSYIRIRHINST